MSFSTVLEIGLGLVLVYYALSLIVSKITGEITKWSELRATDLELGLRELLGDSGKMDALMKHPRIQNLRPIRLNFLSQGARYYKVTDIPASSFALTLFDVLLPSEKTDSPVDDLRDAINGLPDGKTKTSLLGIVNSGVQNLTEARQQVEGWYDDGMQNVGLLFKQHARRIVFVVAAIVTIVTGVDSIAVAQSLWEEPSRRAAVTAKVDAFVADNTAADVEPFLNGLEELDIQVLWDFEVLPNDIGGWIQKLIGLAITWVAASQGSSFWYDVLKRLRSSSGAATAEAKT
jgi:hypothetical protein